MLLVTRESQSLEARKHARNHFEHVLELGALLLFDAEDEDTEDGGDFGGRLCNKRGPFLATVVEVRDGPLESYLLITVKKRSTRRAECM